MKLWDEVVKHAILGTGHQPYSVPEVPGALGEVLHADADADYDSETRLLNVAALLWPYRQLGARPAKLREDTAQDSDVCAAETLPMCSRASANRLRRLLIEDSSPLLREFVELLARHAQRVPYDALPALLTLAKNKPALQDPLTACMGERGRWLCALNSEWRELTAPSSSDDAAWRSGAPSLRLNYLRRLRATDPLQARERLSEAWSQESAKDRLVFLKLLRIGLSPIDIDFLQHCLSDRSQNVRLEACQQLLVLGDNNIARTVEQQILTLFAMEKGLLGRKKLIIRLPERFENDWSRFGLREAVPAGLGVGKKTWWVSQWLTLLGPSRLAKRLGLDLEALLKQINASDYAEAFLDAFAEGALALGDQDYAEHLLLTAKPQDFLGVFLRYAAMLDAPARERHLRNFLETRRGKVFQDFSEAVTLFSHSGPLSAPLTRIFVDKQLPALCEQSAYWQTRYAKDLAPYLSVECFEAVAPVLRELSGREAIDELLALYHYRYQMHQEFL